MRAAAITLMVALAVGAHFQQTQSFRNDWQTQRSFYWQLAWRAPAIESHTALVTYDRITYWTGEPLLGDALNTLYPPRLAAPNVDLWAFELTRTRTVKAIQNGELLSNDYRGLLFSMAAPDDLIVYYLPPAGCLRVLTELDAYDASLPTELSQLAPFSNPANILPSGSPPDAAIFGSEPAPNWCTFYEKAGLARQQGDWPRALALLAQAKQLGLQPTQAAEWRPFIEAYARTGDWAAASELSKQAAGDAGPLCTLWAQLPTEGDEAQAALHAINAALQCE
jgi:hypothetical protein